MLCLRSGKQTQEAMLHFYKIICSLQLRTPIGLEMQDLSSRVVQQAENFSACFERTRADCCRFTHRQWLAQTPEHIHLFQGDLC